MEIHWTGISPRRIDAATLSAQQSIIPYALLVGLIGGIVGAAYVTSMKVLEHFFFPNHWQSGWRDGWHFLVLIGAGIIVALGTRFIGPSGDVELLVDNIHVSGGAEDLRLLRSLVPISLICIGAGGGMGPEAPLVQTGGTLGSWVARRFHRDRVDTRSLTITGMAAAFTVLFGTPLGSAIFALELLHKRGLEYYEALMPAVIGSVVGLAIYYLLTTVGLTPVWSFPAVGNVRGVDLLWAVGCGVVGAIVANLFTYLTEFLRAVFRRLPPLSRPVIGGIALSLLALASPYALTFGEAQINPLTIKTGAALFFLGAAAAKLAGTSITLSSTWKGGFIIPLFFMGVALGRFGHALFPGTNVVVLMAAMMAANNVGVTKTPLGSVLVVSGMAGLKVLPTTLLAALVALFLTSNIGLIESQRARDSADEPAV